MYKRSHIELFKDITNRFAQESKCAFIQVASIAVKDSHIIATGLNGTPAGTENCNDHFMSYWVRTAQYTEKEFKTFQEWTKSNTFRKVHKDWSKVHDIHSELNLLIDANIRGVSLRGADIFSSYSPCCDCAKVLACLKPNAIYFINEYDGTSEESIALLKKCGVALIKI